ncbi:MAG TPA: 3-hydroxyacyl-CoA dehydrogenase family protein [Acidimicrobiales bacterium]|jgi:3-hydroxybutyryl-CoA dehydrogenase|nr:3-hydroxyacyl-CoA dehydrogenase family protein [Acidimicrobiales bacterium]
MNYSIVVHGQSRSFPEGDPFRAAAVPDAAVQVHLGTARDEVPDSEGVDCSLIELDLECLGVRTGEAAGAEGDRRIGFARWQVGEREPSGLVELVVQPASNPAALEAARTVFTEAGFSVAVCRDFSGRILDRLLRPYFNDALRGLDEGLASAADLDKTVRLGLGYPEGPIALLQRLGLVRHHEVCRSLFEAYGAPAYAPARRAVVAAERRQ